jgi:hypothetical protein
MDFDEALDALKEGKKVRGVKWPADSFVWFVNKKGVNQDGKSFDLCFLDTQIDWELYDSTVHLKWEGKNPQ